MVVFCLSVPVVCCLSFVICLWWFVGGCYCYFCCELGESVDSGDSGESSELDELGKPNELGDSNEYSEIW